ncbi:MAG: murein biosynthesis integral membrane protein MurJ, partial [Candidatus Sungbacteria bacterium]|nr:murein biosynthesis integral membrane protein MurJ [Candidatus Sungbacteria bacterium]
MRIRLLNREMSSVHAAALLLGAAGLLSRLCGVVRDRLLASHFGAGRELDIYYAAFQIPDFMSVVFLLGAGTA